MKRLLMVPLAAFWLFNCVGSTGVDQNGQGSKAVPGIAVSHHPSEGIYTIDLTVDGEVFKNVLIDTGSSNLTLFGDLQLCPECTITSGITSFEPQTYTPSTSALYDGKEFQIKFGVGSGTVQSYAAEVGVSGFGQPIDYTIGVYTSGSHLDNVLGLGYPSNAVGVGGSAVTPFLDTFIARNNLDNLFTLNLCAGQNGSFMTIGSIPESISSDSIHYTPIALNSLRPTATLDFYAVAPIALWTAGAALIPFPTQDEGFLTIVDSGTSLLYLPTSVISALARYYESKAGIPNSFWDLYAPGGSTTLDSQQFSQLEDIQLELPGAPGNPSFKISISPSTYTIKSGTIEKPAYYSAISKSFPINADGSKQLVILGAVLFQNNYTIFDRGLSRLGFASNASLCTGN